MEPEYVIATRELTDPTSDPDLRVRPGQALRVRGNRGAPNPFIVETLDKKHSFDIERGNCIPHVRIRLTGFHSWDQEACQGMNEDGKHPFVYGGGTLEVQSSDGQIITVDITLRQDGIFASASKHGEPTLDEIVITPGVTIRSYDA